MTITTNGMDYIAEQFGIGDCFADTGLSWIAYDAGGGSVSESGGTKNIVGRLINDTVYARIELTAPRTGTYTKALLIAANDGRSITLPDISAADSSYCSGGGGGGGTCTPGTRRCRTYSICEACDADGGGWHDVETCGAGYHCSGGYCVADTVPGDRPETGPMEVYVGGGSDCPEGAPSVTLDTSGAYAFFKSEAHEYIGVGGINVHNLSSGCRAHLIWEARVWAGYGHTTCPTTSPEMQEINRYLMDVGSKPISTKMLGASETSVVWGSFEITPGMSGEKTICLSLWGNFSKSALIAELAAAGYSD